MAHILVIEPDRILADIYEQLLRRCGHTVTLCASAQSAIYAVDVFKPALILLELQLIGHSGIEFLYEFRSYTDWQQTPVIILSNVPPSEFVGSRALLADELGVKKYVYKPQLQLAALQSMVDDIVGSPQQSRLVLQ